MTEFIFATTIFSFLLFSERFPKAVTLFRAVDHVPRTPMTIGSFADAPIVFGRLSGRLTFDANSATGLELPTDFFVGAGRVEPCYFECDAIAEKKSVIILMRHKNINYVFPVLNFAISFGK